MFQSLTIRQQRVLEASIDNCLPVSKPVAFWIVLPHTINVCCLSSFQSIKAHKPAYTSLDLSILQLLYLLMVSRKQGIVLLQPQECEYEPSCIIMINTCFYYYLTKLEQQKILTAIPKESGKGFNLSLEAENQENPSQLWMVKSADLEDVYSIYNCSSGLCIEAVKDQNLELHHHKNKDAQKFKFNLVSSEQMECIINEYSKEAMIFVRDNKIVCDVKNANDNELWTLRRVRKHLSMENSAILQMLTSGYVLDVSDNADYAGSIVYQSAWSGMFTQRWKFEKFKSFYLIRNVKSGLVLTVKGKKSKEGNEIIHEKQADANHLHQLWSLQGRGHQCYAIRLASEKELFLGVIRYANERGEAMLTRKAQKNLWRMIGEVDL